MNSSPNTKNTKVQLILCFLREMFEPNNAKKTLSANKAIGTGFCNVVRSVHGGYMEMGHNDQASLSWQLVEEFQPYYEKKDFLIWRGKLPSQQYNARKPTCIVATTKF